MANPTDAESLALALQERLGVHPGEAFEGLLALTFEGGQRAEARFYPREGKVRLSNRVTEAHDGLPRSILLSLLSRNAPGGGLAGGTLAVRESQDRLEIADMLPLALGAVATADIMINQAEAASALSAWIAEQVAAGG